MKYKYNLVFLQTMAEIARNEDKYYLNIENPWISIIFIRQFQLCSSNVSIFKIDH